jgi:hypothetical protein
MFSELKLVDMRKRKSRRDWHSIVRTCSLLHACTRTRLKPHGGARSGWRGIGWRGGIAGMRSASRLTLGHAGGAAGLVEGALTSLMAVSILCGSGSFEKNERARLEPAQKRIEIQLNRRRTFRTHSCKATTPIWLQVRTPDRHLLARACTHARARNH